MGNVFEDRVNVGEVGVGLYFIIEVVLDPDRAFIAWLLVQRHSFSKTISAWKSLDLRLHGVYGLTL